jgi:ADP-ribose pyrophosphatase YjhB (NUDIX family)
MNAPSGDCLGRSLRDFSELDSLLRDAPSPSSIPIRLTEYPKSATSYERQARSVADRGSAASVVAVLLGRGAVVLVERTTTHAGWALPSGSVMTGANESFLQAFQRESLEETGMDIPLSSADLLDVEIRQFVNMDTGERQHTFVGTVVARPVANLVAGLELPLTPDAKAEGLRTVGAYALNALPELIFRDEEKIRDAMQHLEMAA